VLDASSRAKVQEIRRQITEDKGRHRSEIQRAANSEHAVIWQRANATYDEILLALNGSAGTLTAQHVQTLHERCDEAINLRKLEHMALRSREGQILEGVVRTDDDRKVVARSDARRKRESAQWEQFKDAAVADKESISIGDIPFPSKESLLVKSLQTPVRRKKAFQKMAMRWHPDKFIQKFGKKLDDSSEAKERVTAVFQDITNTLQ